jgi:NhaA family Na+:H+ antiporter
MLGLVLGKSGGIGLVSWFAVKAGRAALLEGVTLRQLVGIGFTMALFISGLALADTPFEQEAQLVILISSLLVPGLGLPFCEQRMCRGGRRCWA